MILTRITKLKLLAFVALSGLSLGLIAFNYLGVRQALGVGRYTVAIELSDGSGLHESTTVTYRGAPIGKISHLAITRDGVRAKLDLDADFRLPTSSRVQVHSASAAGEQYVDFVPSSSGPPFLDDGDVVTADRVRPMQSTGELVDSVTRLASSVDPRDVEILLRELSTGLDGSAAAWRTLVTSSLTITDGLNRDLAATTGLLEGLAEFLKTQDKILPDLSASTYDLESVTQQVLSGKSDLETIVDDGVDVVDEVNAIVDENAGDLRILLHDLTSTGQVVKTYLPGAQQVLLIYPAVISGLISASTPEEGAAPGSVKLGFRPNINVPPHCTEGFLPIKDQRAYGDLTTRPMRPDLYCDVPHDDPRDVRGARNNPCFNVPGRRAASVEECLGREIGTVDHPLPPSMRAEIGTYRADTSRVVTDQGMTFRLGESFGGKANERTLPWQKLLAP